MLISTAALAAIGGFFARPVAGRVFRRAQIQRQLSERQFEQFQEAEAAAIRVRGLQPEVKPLETGIGASERLPAAAVKPLTQLIIRRKDVITVGGSVAQRLQIGGRRPQDIDLFIRGSEATRRDVARDIVQTLRKSGVKRVSVVEKPSGDIVTLVFYR